MTDKTKIYCFINDKNYTGGDCIVIAISEEGRNLCSHLSSSIEWAKHDIGITSDWKHNIYKGFYPDGYELVWVDDPESEEFQEILDRANNFKEEIDWNYKYNGTGMTVDQFWKLRGWKKRPGFTENSRPCAKGKLNIPKPQNDEELAYITNKLLGKPLSLSRFTNSFYECAEKYESYSDPVFDKHTKSQYDIDKAIWETFFDYLGTGGIATYSYQSFELKSEESKQRINHWLKNRNEPMRKFFKKDVDNLFKKL